MKIIICDDEKEMLDKIEESCEKMNVCKADIRTYISSRKLCEFLVEKQPEVDLFVLDIEMPDVDGLELKRLISSLYVDTAIVFVTSHGEMMQEAFGKKVLGFLSKDDYEEKLSICIKELQEEKTILMSSHYAEDMQVCDEVYEMEAGELRLLA